MDHKDFDKILSDKLKETQEFEFIESDWENVLGRIEVPEEQKRRSGWMWLLSLGFLMMAGTSLYLATSLRKTNQHLVELTEALAKNTVRVDTVVKEVVVERDLKDQAQVSSSSSTPSFGEAGSTSTPSFARAGSNSNTSGQTNGLKPKEQRLKTSIDQRLKTSINSDWLNSKEQTINTKTTTILNTDKPAKTLSDLRLATLKSNSWATVPNLLQKGAIEEVAVFTKVNQQKKLKYLSVGITGGMTLPRQLSVSEFDRDVNSSTPEVSLLDSGDLSFNRRNGFDAGLLLQYQVGKRWQLTGAVVYQQINYELSERFFNATKGALYDDYALNEFINGVSNLTDSEDTTTAPPISTNVDTISIGNTTIKQKAIEYRLGANYVFRPDRRWRPFLGISVSAMSLRQQELWGNFYEGMIGEEFDYNNSAADKISNLNIKPSSFRWNGVVLSTGFQLAINKRLNWQMEAWYQQPFKTRSDQLYNLAGVRTGLLYRF